VAKVQVALKIRGVHHDHDEIGRRNFRQPMEQHVARDLFVERLRAETVRARQVEHDHGRVLGRGQEPAFLAFDGDARIIADLRAQSRQRVEERGLAAVRIAGEHDIPG